MVGPPRGNAMSHRRLLPVMPAILVFLSVAFSLLPHLSPPACAEAPAIRGHVLDGDGVALPRARVFWGDAFEFSIATDSEGAFVTTAASPRLLRVEADGFFTREIFVEDATRDLRIALRRRASWSGRVIGRPDGEALTGAVATLVGAGGSTLDSQVIGEDGRFTFDELEAVSYTLQIEAPGYCLGRSGPTVPVGAYRTDLALDPAIEIKGLVRGPDGQAAGGARITATEIDEDGTTEDRVAVFETVADEQGVFALGSFSGRLPVILAARIGDDLLAHATIKNPKEASAYELQLARLAEIEACGFYSDSEKPVPGFTLLAESRMESLGRLAAMGAIERSAKAAADAAGCARIRLPAGVFVLRARGEGAISRDIGEFTLDWSTTQRLGRMDMEREALLRVRVVDDDDESPVEAASVRVYSRGQGLTRIADDATNEEGRLQIGGLREGHYDLEVEAEGKHSVWLERVVVPGPESLIRLVPGGTLKGVVVEADTGAPVPSFRLSVFPEEIDPLSSDLRWLALAAVRAPHDEQGAFSLTGLAEGDYGLRVKASGYTTALVPFSVVRGEDAELRVPMERGACADGVILDERSENAIVGAAIQAADDELSMIDAPAPPLAFSDAEGRYSICEMREGTPLTVVVDHPRYAPSVVTLTTEESARILLEEGLDLDGRLHTSDGSGVPHWKVVIAGEGWKKSTKSDEDGNFHFERLPAGRAKVTLIDSLAGEYSDREERYVEIVADEMNEIDIDLGASLRGTIHRSGVPLPQTMIRAIRLHENAGAERTLSVRITYSDEEGSFVLPRLTQGSYAIQAIFGDHLMNRVIQVSPDGGEVELAVGSRELAGVTIDGDLQTTLPGVDVVTWTPPETSLLEGAEYLPTADGLVEIRYFSADVDVTRSDLDGSFRFWVEADAPGIALEHPEFLESGYALEEFQPGQVPLLPLYRGGSLAVRLVGADGTTPCQGTVFLLGDSEQASIGTDALGSATFPSVRSGVYDLWGRCSFGAPTRLGGVEVGAGDELDEYLVIGEGAEVALTLPVGTSKPAQRLSLFGGNYDLSHWILRGLLATASTTEGDEGTLTLSMNNFPAGAYRITDRETGNSAWFEVGESDRAEVALTEADR